MAAAIGESEPNALQGLERIVIQALSGDDDQAPTLTLESLPSFDVLQPIGTHIAMVSAVVLNDELEFGIAKIESLRPVAIQFTKDVVDLGLGQSTQHNEHPQPRLPRRIDSRSHVRGRSAGQSSALTQVAIGRHDQLPGVVRL